MPTPKHELSHEEKTFEEVSSIHCTERKPSELNPGKHTCEINHFTRGQRTEQSTKVQFIDEIEVDAGMFHDAEFDGVYGSVKVNQEETDLLFSAFPPEDAVCRLTTPNIHSRKLVCERKGNSSPPR